MCSVTACPIQLPQTSGGFKLQNTVTSLYEKLRINIAYHAVCSGLLGGSARLAVATAEQSRPFGKCRCLLLHSCMHRLLRCMSFHSSRTFELAAVASQASLVVVTATGTRPARTASWLLGSLMLANMVVIS